MLIACPFVGWSGSPNRNGIAVVPCPLFARDSGADLSAVKSIDITQNGRARLEI
jgi:hypothetical protein